MEEEIEKKSKEEEEKKPSTRRDSNPRPQEFNLQSCAIPLCYNHSPTWQYIRSSARKWLDWPLSFSSNFYLVVGGKVWNCFRVILLSSCRRAIPMGASWREGRSKHREHEISPIWSKLMLIRDPSNEQNVSVVIHHYKLSFYERYFLLIELAPGVFKSFKSCRRRSPVQCPDTSSWWAHVPQIG